MARIPTVFIGIGGEGTEIVRKVRRKIVAMSKIDTTSFAPEMYQFLSMDPAPPGLEPDEADMSSPCPMVCVTMAGFDRMTVERCLTQDVYEDMKQAWYPGYKPDACHAGYLGVPLNGRFGLRLSCNRVGEVGGGVIGGIEKAIARATDAEATEPPDQPDAMHVILCSSLCGGTGAGALTDLGYLVRLLAKNRGKSAGITGVLVLPEVMALKTGEVAVPYANAYAQLRELNWYMSEPGHDAAKTIRSVFHDVRMSPQVEIREGEGGNLPDSRPMDRCLLVSTEGLRGGVLNSYSLLMNMVAESLYLITAGTKQAEYMFNMPPASIKVPGSNEVRPVRFGGFGSRTIRFPADRVAAYLMRKAACVLLSEYVMHPEGAQREATVHFKKLDDSEFPITFQYATKRIREQRLGHDLRLKAQAENVGPKGVPLKKFLETISKACEEEVCAEGGKIIKKLQSVVDVHRRHICEQIQHKVDAIFAEQDNANAIGEAAVYLSLIKRYCVGLVGGGHEARREDDRTLGEQAADLKESAREWTADSSVKRTRIEEKWGLFSKGVYRAGVLNAARTIIDEMLESRLYEMLHEMYRDIGDYAELRKKPLRFLQERVADGLKREFESQPEAALAGGEHDVFGGGFEKLICADVKTVDQIVAPNVGLFDEMNAERQQTELRSAAVRLLPEVCAMYNDMRRELEVITKDHDGYLEQRRELYKSQLREVLEREVGDEIRKELVSNFNIGHALLHHAVQEGNAERQLQFARDTLEELGQSPEVFCGMDTQAPGSYGFAPAASRCVCVNASVVNAAITQVSGNAFDVRKGVFPNGVFVDEELKDPFRVTSLVANTGWPLFALNRIGEYHGLYDDSKLRRGLPLHTDYRFEGGDYDSQYRLPDVEVIGRGDDADILLFFLAEQDWWRGLDDFRDDPSDEWAGDIPPLVWREGTRHYYNWRGPDGKKDGCLGRENAQKTFIRNKKRVKQGIYDQVSRRWNSNFNKVQKKQKLTQLKQDKAKQLEECGHNDLRRTYENEIRIINDRISKNAYDI